MQGRSTGAKTAINPLAQGGSATAINAALPQGPAIALERGDLLLDRYQVDSPLDVSSGEADLFLVHDEQAGGRPCVAKFYRRQFSLNAEIIDRLTALRSPHITEILAAGTLEDRAYEIYPYYRRGSLQGRLCAPDELRALVIPCVNEGLRALHGAGIVHKDVKPSNLMLRDDGEGVVIIDFGISTATAADGADLRTVLGVTPDYAAPEVKYKRYLPASDYYSLGITLYELCFGTTPFQADAFDAYAEPGGRIPIPDGADAAFANLLYGLTEPSADPDRDENHRRWTYDLVAAWCEGRPTPRPWDLARATTTTEPYTFRDGSYHTVRETFLAFFDYWEEGKEQVFRGIALPFFRRFDPRTATLLLRAEDAVRRGEDEDTVFCALLLDVVPEIEGLPWRGGARGRIHTSMRELGRALIKPMHATLTTSEGMAAALLGGRLASRLARRVGEHELLGDILTLEELYAGAEDDKRGRTVLCHRLARTLSGDKDLHRFGEVVVSGEQLAKILRKKLDVSYAEYSSACERVMDGDGNLRPYFEAWLIALGLEDKLELWRRSVRK